VVRNEAIIEDDPARMTLFRLWIPEDVLIVWAKSAGVALGIIRRDSGCKQVTIIILTFACLFSVLLRYCYGHIVHYAHLRSALKVKKYPAQILLK
jgi:hypothetical protein